MELEGTEAVLGRFLRDLPSRYDNRYTTSAETELRTRLCTSLVLNQTENLPLLYRGEQPTDPGIDWSLRKAQGAVEGAEYTDAARGAPCGHIFRNGESAYHCKTCAADSTCVLCARCFAESDHDGHAVFVHVSPGNSGCCDCADDEAWVKPVQCSIHRAIETSEATTGGKAPQPAGLPQEYREAVRQTIGKALDYMCDVFSCSPEQLRLPKTEETVLADERMSRLDPAKYGGPEPLEERTEWALMLWNDEKHTVEQVMEQVARACHKPKSYGRQRAYEVDAVGRSIVAHARRLSQLLEMATIIEQIKVSVTIRSARDTFREEMCGTIVDWLSDISGCSVGSDDHILRTTICSELFCRWQVNTPRPSQLAGQVGIHDHEIEDREYRNMSDRLVQFTAILGNNLAQDATDTDDDDEDDDELDEQLDVMGDVISVGPNTGDNEFPARVLEPPTLLAPTTPEIPRIVRRARIIAADAMDVEDGNGNVIVFPGNADVDVNMEGTDAENANEVFEATMAGYPAPPPPPAGVALSPSISRQGSITESQFGATSQGSDDAETVVGASSSRLPLLPKTPRSRGKRGKLRDKPEKYWLIRPSGSIFSTDQPTAENLTERLRIDFLILYDLRLWKNLRDTLRHLYISTVITLPEYKRLLGIRFAGLYTLLAQLYLIADREPDHSIVNVSMQLLTTPSITAEVIERANFLTHLMAILYTFLTTRQVGYPKDVLPYATLAFDAGAITNRRMFHFFGDARYIFQATSVQDKIRSEPRYLRQFMDLVKLHQGICPNVRAVGEHVEYETDAWLSASVIVKEINRLAKLVIDSFLALKSEDEKAVRQITTAMHDIICITTFSSLGLESTRFPTSEIKAPIGFRDVSENPGRTCSIPDVKVLDAHMSFHHPLHYMASWILQAGKFLSRDQVRATFFTEVADPSAIKAQFSGGKLNESGPFAPFVKPHDWISALFDGPLRVCVWLAQMRASMWVRNGMTLRHQMHSYRSTTHRDITYQRDIFMLQAGMVLVDDHDAGIVGEKFLLQMIYRFDLQHWLKGSYQFGQGYEDGQHVDVIEDFFHLLVIILTERDDLLVSSENGNPSTRTIQRDIAHALCFKSQSYSDLSTRLTDRITEIDPFDSILEEMTTYKAPEGLNDSGTFELKPEHLNLVDPYYAFYSRNQREEADNICRDHQAKQTNTPKADVVLVPNLTPIRQGLFTELASFTRTAPFARMILMALSFAVKGYEGTSVARPRLESIVQLVLHLIIIALGEELPTDTPTKSFIQNMLSPFPLRNSEPTTIFCSLKAILQIGEFAACHPKAIYILKRVQQMRPGLFAEQHLLESEPRILHTPDSTAEKEQKRKQALERQAKVLAQFKAQQNDFMSNQGIDWDTDDMSEDSFQEAMEDVQHDLPETQTVRDYPADACILCQEETNDDRLYGCFAFISGSSIQRQTPLNDDDYVQEVVDTPESLDRSADTVRPFGKCAKNKVLVEKTTADGTVVVQQAQVLSEGFRDTKYLLRDHVITGCGHMMHFACFETYLSATARRQSHQISRNHPERLEKQEFLCPLCKALGNAFLPVIWKPRKESYPGLLGSASQPFDEWLVGDMSTLVAKLKVPAQADETMPTLLPPAARSELARQYIGTNLKSKLSEQILHGPVQQPSPSRRLSAARALAAILDVRNMGGPDSDSVRDADSPPTTVSQELSRAYKLLGESLRARAEAHQERSLGRMPFSNVVQTIASTIAATEIKSRGTYGHGCLIDTIPDHVLANLRILCETAAAMMATEVQRDAAFTSATHRQESYGLSTLFALEDADTDVIAPSILRNHNAFWSLTACSYLPNNDWSAHGHNLVQLALIDELIKVAYVHMQFRGAGTGAEKGLSAPGSEVEDPLFSAFFDLVAEMHIEALHGTAHNKPPSILPYFSRILKRILLRHALIFLRKTLLLAHVRSGVDFTVASASLDPGAPELDRLCTLLRIPPVPVLINLFLSQSAAGIKLREIGKRHFAVEKLSTISSGTPCIDHPAIFELIGLPRTFDALSEEAVRRRCPTTGKHVSDPVVCLFCGDIFCSQAGCCRVRGMGGAQQHLQKCSKPVGLFINIRKCMVLFLHEQHGSWGYAPYLDKHGETDPALRRQQQLFLNQKRYDKLLRDVWLGHGIKDVISRRLEGDVNTGGWETL